MSRELLLLGAQTSSIFGIFTPNRGEDEPILTSAYFSYGLVGSTTAVIPGIKVRKNCPKNIPRNMCDLMIPTMKHPSYRWKSCLFTFGFVCLFFCKHSC